MKFKKFSLSRPATRGGGASAARPKFGGKPASSLGKPSKPTRDRKFGRNSTRPGGSTRPSLRAQLEAPVETRRKADPTTTRRVAFLSVVLAVMLVFLTPALRSYLDQRSEIADLKRAKAQNSAAVTKLEAEKARWSDPNYVKQQAEQRLGYADPGKQAVIYVDRGSVSHTVPSAQSAPSTIYSAHPWYGQVWSSISTKTNVEK